MENASCFVFLSTKGNETNGLLCAGNTYYMMYFVQSVFYRLFSALPSVGVVHLHENLVFA